MKLDGSLLFLHDWGLECSQASAALQNHLVRRSSQDFKTAQ